MPWELPAFFDIASNVAGDNQTSFVSSDRYLRALGQVGGA